jgi:hypothetical protein
VRSERAPQCSFGAREVSSGSQEEAAAAAADGNRPGAIEHGAALFEPRNDRLGLLGATQGDERLGCVAVEESPQGRRLGHPAHGGHGSGRRDPGGRGRIVTLRQREEAERRKRPDRGVGPAGALKQRERSLGVEVGLLGASGIGGDLRAVRERERPTDRRLQLEQPFDALVHCGGRAREVAAPALEPDSGVLRPGEPVLGPAVVPSRATGHQHRARLLEAGRP